MAHELAHYLNHKDNIKDTSNAQYHNKHFKAQAERLLLRVSSRHKRFGYGITEETEDFKKLVAEDFKPNPNAFKIFQADIEQEPKSKSRLLLFMCACGSKIRTARNENKPLRAVCQYCKTEFSEVRK